MDDVKPVSRQSDSTARVGFSGISDFTPGPGTDTIAIIDGDFGEFACPGFPAFAETNTALL